MVRVLSIIIGGTFILAVLAMRVTREFEFAKWQVSIALFILGILLYFCNVFLIRHFVKTRTPELAQDDLWEATAGTGIVPKWVSVIGLLSFSAFITGVLPWVISLFKS